MLKQQDFRQGIERLKTEVQNRQRLDHHALQTEWLASETAVTRRKSAGQSPVDMVSPQLLRLRSKDDKRREMLAAARQARLMENEKVKERMFPDANERRIARRPRDSIQDPVPPIITTLVVRTGPMSTVERRTSYIDS